MSVSASHETLDRYGFIDAIRGFAALYVVAFHLVYIPTPNLQLPYWLTSFVNNGDTGVTLFFIVSAFTLTYSMKQRENEYHVTLHYFIRRFFRIVPLFYFWLLLSLIRDLVFFHATHSIQDVLLSVFFLFNFIPGKSTGIVWASWTLGVEMIFYLLFPLIFKYANTFWKSLGFLLLTIFISQFWTLNINHYVPGISPEFVIFSIIFRLPTFAFGVVLFYIFEKITQMKIDSTGIAFMLLSASALGYYSIISANINDYGVILYWKAAICSLFILGLGLIINRIFVNKITRFYGVISYSLYLNHPSLVMLMVPLFRYTYSLSLPTTIKYGLSLVLLLIMVTISSILTYNLIEKPGMQLGRLILKKGENLNIFSRQFAKSLLQKF